MKRKIGFLGLVLVGIIMLFSVIIKEEQSCSQAVLKKHEEEKKAIIKTKWPFAWKYRVMPIMTKDGEKVESDVKEKHSGDPKNFQSEGLVADPFVLYDQGKFRMWFSATTYNKDDKEIQGIAYSESGDGLIWSDPKIKDGQVQLVVSPATAVDGWDSLAMETPSVVKNPVTGEYMLYYAGRFKDEAYYIGLATSQDGLKWDKHFEPVLKPLNVWEQPVINQKGQLSGGVLEPTVIYDEEEQKFKLWYAALGESNGVWGGRIGYATSTDGINWERYPEPVFIPGEEGVWDAQWVSHNNVIKDPQKGYHLFYAGGKNEEAGLYGGIGHAYSEDGVHWVRNPDNPIIKKEPETWRSALVGGPTALLKNNQLFLWYMGSKRDDFGEVYFGLATAKILLTNSQTE